jgi:hypothetical protein
MKHSIKPLLSLFALWTLVAFATSCTSETLAPESPATGGLEPGVHLTLNAPTVSIASASTKAGTARAIESGVLYIQLVDANGVTFKDERGKPRQSYYTYNSSTSEWVLDANPIDAEMSTPIRITGGAANYRMRALANIKMVGACSIPFTFYDGVKITNNGDATGSYTLTLTPNLTAAIEIKLVANNGTTFPAGEEATVQLQSVDKVAMGLEVDLFTLISKVNDTNVNNVAFLIANEILDSYSTHAQMPTKEYTTGLITDIKPQTIPAGTPLATIIKEGKTYSCKASQAMTFEAGKKHQITVSLGTKATIKELKIAPWNAGTGIDIDNTPVTQQVNGAYK